MEDALGSEESNTGKWLMYVFYLFLFTFLLFGLIGIWDAKGTTFGIFVFYILMLPFLGLIPIAIDNVLTKKEAPLDTVTFEKNAPIQLGMGLQIAIGIIASIVLSAFILVTGQAFVNAPVMQIFETKVGEALLSGVAGMVEVIAIFGVLYPTLHYIMSKIFGFFGTILSLLLIIAIFVGFHSIVYEFNAPAMISVGLFGLIFQALPIYFFRSTIIPLFLHFFNNFLIVLFQGSIAVGIFLG